MLRKSSDTALQPSDNVIGYLFSSSYLGCDSDGGVDVQHVGDEHQHAEVGESLVNGEICVLPEVSSHIAFILR